MLRRRRWKWENFDICYDDFVVHSEYEPLQPVIRHVLVRRSLTSTNLPTSSPSIHLFTTHATFPAIDLVEGAARLSCSSSFPLCVASSEVSFAVSRTRH